MIDIISLTPSRIRLWALAVLLLLIACSSLSRTTMMAEDFQVTLFSGGNFLLSDQIEKKSVVLNFWYPSCPPCRAEMPWFIDFQTAFRNEGFRVLGVSLDEPGWSAIRPFLERQPVNYLIALADTPERLLPFGLINILPTTWLIDRNGRIAAEHVGLVRRDEIEAEIDQLLNE